MPLLFPVTPLTVYQIGVTCLANFTLLNAISARFAFRRPTPVSAGDRADWPSLSVLVPARDEAATIGACVRSLCENGYPGALEVLILDDNSTDGTGQIACDAAEGDGRVRVLTGGPLCDGWKGKPNALRQLAGHATSEMLLLTDADCTFFPGALAAAVRHRERVRADCLSLIPDLVCGSFWENVVVPLQYDVVFRTLPVYFVAHSKNPALAAANGAFLLLPRAIYAALGGHEAVRSEMAEDIKFAQHFKRSGRRLAYGDGSTVYRVRMYDSLRGIWDGFSKNLFSAMGRSLPVLVVWCLFQLTTQVLPFLFAAIGIATGRHTLALLWLPAYQAAVALGVRVALTLRFRQSLWAVALHPVGWAITVGMACNSALLALSGKGHAWKGRVYR